MSSFAPIRVAAALVVAMASVSLASHARPEPPPPAASAPVERAVARALREGDRIPLNRASAEDLELLPGIGPSIARRIVESREAEGPFPTVDALDRVVGVGPRTVERLRPFLTAGDATGAPQ